MKKFNNLVAVILLVGNIFVQPIISIQQVFAQDDASESIITEESVPEIVSQEAPVVETVEETSSEEVVEPPSEEVTPPVSEEAESSVDDTSSETEVDSEEVSEEESESEESEESEEDEEKEAVTSIVYRNSNNTVSNLRTGSKARYSFTVTNSEAALTDATLRLTLTGDAIEAFASNEDYFPGKGYGSLVNAYYSNGNFIVDYAIGELSADFNRNFDFEFKTIDDRSMTNGQQVLVKAEVIKTDQSVLASSGPEYYSFVTRQPQFRTNVTYPTEEAASDDDSEPAQQTTLIDFFFSMGTEGQGNGSGRSAVTTISVAVNVPASLEFDAIANDGWSYDEASRVATYTFAPDATIFDTELSLPTGLVLISNGETIEETINASATFAFVNGQVVEKTNAPEVMMMAISGDLSIQSVIQDNLVLSFEFIINPGQASERELSNNEIVEADLAGMNTIRLRYGLTKPDDRDITEGDTYTIDLPEIFKGYQLSNEPIGIGDEIVGYFDIIEGKIIITFLDAVNDFDDVEMFVTVTGDFNSELFEENEETVVNVPLQGEADFKVTIRPEQEPYSGEDKKVAGNPYVLDGNQEKVYTNRNPEFVDWTVTANDSMDTISNAKVIDNLGDNLELVTDSVKVYRITRNYKNEEISIEQISIAPVPTSTGFELELGAIEDAYEISYTTRIVRPDGGGELTINNGARIVLDDNEKDVSDDIHVSWSVELPVIQKDGNLSSERADIIEWTVQYNFGKEMLGDSITLLDTLSDGVINLDSVIVKEVFPDIDGGFNNNDAVPISVTPTPTEDGMTLPGLDANGRAYVITFTSTVPVGLNGTIVNTIADNLDPSNSDNADVPVNTIPTGTKVGEQLVDDEGKPYIEWTITMNSEKIDVPSIEVRDVFDQSMLKFNVNNSTLFELTKDDGASADNFTIEAYTHDDGRTGFYLNVTNAGPSEYKFVYRTYYTVAGMNEPQLANNAELVFLDGNGKGIGEKITVNPTIEGPKSGINKSGAYINTTDNAQQIQWTVTFNSSKILLNAGTTLTDNFVSGNYSLIPDTFEVTGLAQGDYTIGPGTTTGFVLTLNEASNSIITVKFKTTTDDANSNNATHKNEAVLKWQGGEEKDDAEVGIRHPEINKNGSVVINTDGTKSINWTIDFNKKANVIHDFKLTDTYTPTTVTLSPIVIKTGGTDVTSEFTISPERTGGTFTVSKDKLDAVAYQLTYTTTLSAEEEAKEIKNTASITYTGGSDEKEATIPSPKIGVDKVAVGKVDKTETGDFINWKITANTDAANNYVNLVNAVLEDTIPSDQKLVADSIGVVRVGDNQFVFDASSIISIDNNQFTINLPDGPYQYIVTFRTEILEYPSVSGEVGHYKNNVKLTNQPGVDGIESSDTAEAWIDFFADGTHNNATKEGIINDETENVDWKVLLNPLGLTIHNVRIVDKLTGDHHYIEDSITLWDGTDPENPVLLDSSAYDVDVNAGEFTVSITGTGTITTPIFVTYSTRINADVIGRRDLSNKVQLYGRGREEAIDEESTSYEAYQWFYGGGGSGRTLEFTLNKVNSGSDKVANATFEFIRVTASGTQVPLNNIVTTDDNGTFHLTGVRAGRYIVNELSTPAAYEKLTRPIYVILGYGSATEGDYKVTVTDANWQPITDEAAFAIGNTLTIVNQFKTTDVSATKNWLPATLEEGNHPTVWLKLYRKVFGSTEVAVDVELKQISGATNIETVIWPGLEQFSPEGERYEYSVKEVDQDGNPYTPDGYTKVENGLTVTNTNVQKETVSGTKNWVDYDNAHKTRPTYIVVRLLRNDQLFAEKTISADDNWEYSFTNLEKFDSDGKLYNYTITEIVPAPYTMSVDGYDLTNTYDVSEETTEINGVKIWDDWNNQLGSRPDSVTILLSLDGNPYPDAENQLSATATEDTDWTYSFSELPKYDEKGEELKYTVSEEVVAGYEEAVIDGYTITNKLINDETTTVNGTKVWDDWNDLLGRRPEQVEILLLRNGKPYPDAENQAVAIANEANGWTFEFENLPKYDDNGIAFEYTVSEETIEGYHPAKIDGFVVTNKLINDVTTSIDVTKKWEDYGNKLGTRPTDIAIYLKQNDKNYDFALVDASFATVDEDVWQYTFTELPKYDENGVEYTYTVHEVVQSPYTHEIDQETLTITNTYVSDETVEFSGQKVWNDYNDEFDTRPEDITVTLYQNDEAMVGDKFTQIVTPNAAGNWNFSFTDLPKHDAAGDEYVYSVREVTLEGYETSYDGNFIINKVDPLTTAVAGQKFWDDYYNAFDTRPESITVNLFQNGDIYYSTPVTEADDWKYSFTDLPMHDADGELYVYTVEEELSEEAAELYTSVVDGNDIYNTYVNTETVDIIGRKVWNDYNNQFETRPASVLMILYQNNKVLETLPVSADIDGDANEWSFEFTGLAKYDAEGNEYAYRVEELVNVPYTSVKTGSEAEAVIFTNTYVNTDVIDYTGNKVWNDYNNVHGLRPSEVTINLYQTIEGEEAGDPIESTTATAANNWTYVFEDLDKYDAEGNEYIYTVDEVAVPGYDTEIYGSTIVNTLQTTEVSGVKTWSDFDNQYNTRPAFITVNLLQATEGLDDSEVVFASKRVAAIDDWAYSFTDLPVVDGEGNAYSYSIKEEEFRGYTSIVEEEYNLINTLETQDISGEKVWIGTDNPYTTHPEVITVNLVQTVKGSSDSVVLASQDVTAANDWVFEFLDVPVYDLNGNTYIYTVTENVVPGYTTDIAFVDGIFKVTNSLITVDLAGTKTWDDWFGTEAYDNQLSSRPENITVNLLQNGVQITDQVVEPDEDNNWSYVFDNLPKFDANGLEYQYTVEEVSVDNYETETNGKDITNTYLNTETIDLPVVKVWVDYSDKHDTRPENVALLLFRNDETVAYRTVLLTDDGNGDDTWLYTFTDLPKYDEAGEAYSYRVDEVVTSPYTKVVEGSTITNTYISTETVDYQGQKVWNDYDNEFDTRPEDITVTLYQNDVAMDGEEFTQTVTPNAAGNWNFSFTDLPKHDAAGDEYVYTVREVTVDGYETSYDGNFIINKVDPLDTVVAGQKFWDDYDNAFETRPESITVNLFQNGEFYKSTSVTEADDWYYSFTDIPMHDADGELYDYTVEEELSDEAAEFYASVVDGHDIYNTYVNTETVDINGQKVWNDYNNQFKTRPSSILLVLYRNGVEQSVKQVDAVAGNVWEFSITDLPKYDEAGIAYVYEVKELTSAPYTSETVVDEDGLVTFTNTYVNTEVTALSGSKVWEDFDDYYGLRPTSIEVVLYQNGEAFDSKVVDLDRLGNMRYSFTELPKYDELGALFNYSVGDDVHAYDMENYYDDLINTLNTIDVEGMKTWDDFDDVYGLRPATIQINLNQTIEGSDESVVLHSTEISATENWRYAFNDVPQFDAAGNEYIYTITEEAIEDQPMGAYDVDSDGYDLINHLITTEVPVTKSWHDFEDAYGLRPEAITFNLLQDDELFASETVTADENWSHIFENLPQYNAAGEEYVYTVTEDAVYAYSTEITDYVVSNTLITRDIEGTKAWNDQDDFYALRPEAITVNLVQGIETSTETRVLKTLQVTADTDWTFEFNDVPVYDAAGNEYIYTLTEEVNEAYDVAIDNETYLITNSLKVTDVEGNKVWLDYDNGFGLRPEAITVRLHQTLTGSVTSVELFDQVVTADSDWTFVFTDLPVVNAEGVEYIYTVTEDTVNAYETTIEDTVITNDLITIPISGLKVWNDYNDKFEHRPDFITVNLLQNGELLQAIEVTADEDGVWSYSFGQVPEFDAEGQAYVYTVTEEAVAEYNEAEINGTIITNTYVNTEVTSVSGEKLWDDFDNRLDSRPEAITIVLLQNGEAYLDAQEVTADTNNQWIYSFTDLPKYDELGEAYEYTIEELAVEGYETSYGDNGEILNTLIPAISVSVGDYVWFDANKDGLQDDADVPIAVVVLTIENEDGSPVTDIEGLPVGPQITDENGHYSFDKLPADAIYIVRIDHDASAEALKNYVPTLDETGDDHSIDSSTWSATSRHLVEDEERDPTLDFGFVLKKVSVGDYVWIDENKDGLQDETDTPLAGVVLTITTKDGEPVTDINGKSVGPTTTDENGWYTFENLPANETYVVTIDQAASSEALKGLKPTLVNEGDNSEIDSSLWSETSRHLTEDEERDPTLDFGFVRKQVSVGDYVWEDVNRDGLQDDTDIPLAGVVLTITTKDGKPVTDVNGDPVGPTTTDEKGWYTFDNLPADETYVVTIDQAASSEALKGLKPTLSNVGNNSEIDSSLWSETSRHLTEDEERDPTLDFGFVRPRVSVGDYVWFDKNKDGIQDADEKGIANVILEIVDKDGNPVTDVFGNPVEPTTTDENGYYSFDDLPIDNTYTVRVRRDQPVLDGYTPTKHEQGNDNSVDSSTWEATSRHLTEDEERDPTLDFGFYVPKGSVGDYVWFDANNDGLQDATDVPLKGVVLTIEDEQGNPVTDIFGNVVQPVTTDENGYYIFDNLPLGHRYTVRIDQAASTDVLKDYQTALEEQGNDNSIDSSTWFTTSVLLEVDGQHDPTLDFGFVKKPGEKTPDKPGKPGEKLPETGEESFAWLAGIVLVLGATLLYFGNRNRRKN